MRRLVLLLIVVTLLLLPVSVVLADTSDSVVVTAVGFIVGRPGDFTLTYVNDHVVEIGWSMGDNATATMIRAAVGRLPESRTDGYLVYSGNLTSCNDTAVSLDETATAIYYRAWSQREDGVWEEQGVSDSLEGFGMTTLAIALIVLVFTMIAIYKRDAVFYMLSVIGWLFMTFYLVNRDYPEENAYLPYAIAAFCLSITLVMAIQALRIYFSDKTRGPTSKDIQAEHRKKVLKLVTPKGKPWYYEE